LVQAQIVNGTLTGTVADASGAVVPNANVTLKNEASGDIRRTVSNAEGYFTFAAVPPSTYTVSVEAQGFQKWQQVGIIINAGDKKNVSDIALAVGSSTETVEVSGVAAEISTVDSGEKSEVVNGRELQNVAIVGSNAAEFIKIMPGMAMTTGTQNGASFSGEQHGTGQGPIGSFSANGQRTGALDITSDGAHIIDPGCNCGQAVDVNVDMTQEMKVMTSNFGADAQKGPILISAVGKSGTSAFHGQAYLYARDASLSGNDWLNNAQGYTSAGPVAPRPETRYLYPGGNIGGPVIIPGTNFNKNRDKLFFFFAYEYYKQTVDNGLYQAFVPTQDMRNGNFSQAALDAAKNGAYVGYQVNDPIKTYPGGIVPVSQIDPVGQAMLNMYPLPNANPATNGGFNFVQVSTKPLNAYQLRPRVDWSISDNTKLFISYNRQRDVGYFTDTLWWRPTPTVPYPTRLLSNNESDSISANLTHVFSPSLTNEFIYTFTRLNLPNAFEDPSKVDPASLGINVPSIFGGAPHEIPDLTGWGGGYANLIQPSGYQVSGSLYAYKDLPTIADNLSKVWGTHTMRFGFYWEAAKNDQPTSNSANGQYINANWGGNSTGNAYADLLTGRLAQYSETNKDVLLIMNYHSVDFYAQDSWKVTRRLTLDYGMRFSHLGPWGDIGGNNGFAVWRPDLYSNDPADKSKITGVLWHSRDASVPLSGSPSRALFYNPRFGAAWDIFGTGKTVLRGGWGMYRFHDEQNVQSGALNITQGAYGYTTPGSLLISDIGKIVPGALAPGSITVLDPHDDQQPMTRSYSFTISQRVPLRSLFEISYVGNKSEYLSNWNNNLFRPNQLGNGALWQYTDIWTPDNNYGPNADPYRPYQNYSGAGGIKIINHEMYSNYNAMQASWNKQAGRLNFLVNYTFSKALGIRGEGNNNQGDPTTLANNYGTLPNDRTHIFNAAYVFEVPNMNGGNKFVRGVANGWQVSGITQWQSGPNLQVVGSSNFNIGGTIPAGSVLPNGIVTTKDVGLGAVQINGTPDINAQPIMTCDPRSNLGPNQFINGNCFAVPTPGHNGPFILPYIKGPAFLNSDLSLFKNFNFSEQKKLQFRISGYNFLNHPITSFVNGDNNLNLSFDASGKLSNSRFGYADWKTGHRVIQLAVKFYF
jgi:hypothetical protein